MYKRQLVQRTRQQDPLFLPAGDARAHVADQRVVTHRHGLCLLYTSDAADERSSVDLGGRRILKKKIRALSRT